MYKLIILEMGWWEIRISWSLFYGIVLEFYVWIVWLLEIGVYWMGKMV